MFRKFLAGSLVLAATNSAIAQDATTTDATDWTKAVSAGLSLTDGNSNATNFNLNGKLGREYKDEVWRFEADYNFGDTKETPDSPRTETRNDYRLLGDYRHIFNDFYFGGIGADLRHDEIADLNYRFTVSPSVGMYVIKEDDLKLSLEAGPSYVFEELGGVSNDYLAPRIANRLDWKISDTAKLFQTAEYLFDISDSNAYLLNAEIGIETTVTELVSLVVSIKDAYNNNPAEGKEKNDIAIISGLKLNL
jgi:putative salt-induced outer membrane protein YdiY